MRCRPFTWLYCSLMSCAAAGRERAAHGQRMRVVLHSAALHYAALTTDTTNDMQVQAGHAALLLADALR